MTPPIEQPTPKAPALAMAHAYEEAPGVKKLARSLAGHSRAELRDVLASVWVCLMETIIFALIFFCFINATAYVTHQMNTPWLITSNIILFALVIVVTVFRSRARIHWLFKSETSSLVENKTLRSVVKQSRQAAKQLGSTIIPVLTEEHVTSVERAHKAMTTAAAASNIKLDASDHARLTTLILKDLSREALLLDLITNRGITTMDEIEEALQNIEENTVTPLQSGWL